jgi:hypothetical protein
VKDFRPPSVPLAFLDEYPFVDGAGQCNETVAATNHRGNFIGRKRQTDDVFLMPVEDGRNLTRFAQTAIPTFADFLTVLYRQFLDFCHNKTLSTGLRRIAIGYRTMLPLLQSARFLSLMYCFLTFNDHRMPGHIRPGNTGP